MSRVSVTAPPGIYLPEYSRNRAHSTGIYTTTDNAYIHMYVVAVRYGRIVRQVSRVALRADLGLLKWHALVR